MSRRWLARMALEPLVDESCTGLSIHPPLVMVISPGVMLVTGVSVAGRPIRSSSSAILSAPSTRTILYDVCPSYLLPSRLSCHSSSQISSGFWISGLISSYTSVGLLLGSPFATSRKAARAASRCSMISCCNTSGGGRSSRLSKLSFFNQKISRLALSRAINSS